jgi:hypothetical protein
MLDQLNSSSELALLAECRDELVIPIEAEWLVAQTGYAKSTEVERRRFPRLRTHLRLPMQLLSTLPALPREEAWHAVRVIDLSKLGVGLLHSAQLYPRERVRLAVKSGLQLAEVNWCQRVGDHCFRVGCRFITDSQN